MAKALVSSLKQDRVPLAALLFPLVIVVVLLIPHIGGAALPG